MMSRARFCRSGFTLIELMIVIALVAVVLTLAAPAFNEFIVLQRLKSVHAQVVTDLQFARSEAVSRGVPVQVQFQVATAAAPMSCYIVYTDQPLNRALLCDCSAAEGARCTDAAAREIRTVQVPTSLGVRVEPMPGQATNFYFDPRTGGMTPGFQDKPGPYPGQIAVDAFVDASRTFRDIVGPTGRVKVCSPVGSTLNSGPCL